MFDDDRRTMFLLSYFTVDSQVREVPIEPCSRQKVHVSDEPAIFC